MNFYQNIAPFSDYLFSIRKLKDYLSIDLLFPLKWSIPKSMLETTETVPFNSETNETKGLSFVCPLNEQSISQTLAKINKIIKLNKEKEQKEILFKHTIEELKKTFEKNDLDTLQKLYFDFEIEEDIPNLNDYESGKSEEPTTLELAE